MHSPPVVRTMSGGSTRGQQQKGLSDDDSVRRRRARRDFFAAQYRDFGRYRSVARTTATALGVSFLDIHPSAALRPDAARARYTGRRWKKDIVRKLANGSTVTERGGEYPMDCVHMCLPGPPDAWSYQIFNLILERVPLPLTGRASPTAATGHLVQREVRRGEFLPRSPGIPLYDVPSASSEWWWPYKRVRPT